MCRNRERNDDVADGDDLVLLAHNINDNGHINANDYTDNAVNDDDEEKQMPTDIMENDDDDDDTAEIKNNNTNDVPNTDSEPNEHIKQSSIYKNDNNNEIIEHTTTTTSASPPPTTTTDNELTYEYNDAIQSTIGNDILRKQWHRRLRTPVWARSSIQFPFCFFVLFLFQRKPSHNTFSIYSNWRAILFGFFFLLDLRTK